MSHERGDRRPHGRHAILLSWGAVIGITALVAACSASAKPTAGVPSHHASASPAPTTTTTAALISRNVPAYASPSSPAGSPASFGNDGDYRHEFSAPPTTALVLDLSRVAAARRSRALVSWYNLETEFYPPGNSGFFYYNVPRDYTIDVSGARGGGQPPGGSDSSWRTVADVTGNPYSARMHVVDLDGANWIRMRVTAIRGSPGNMTAGFKLDVLDANEAGNNTWLFLGDSITQGAMAYNVPATFPEQVNAARPQVYPAQVDGGEGGWTSASPLENDPTSGKQFLREFLDTFPAHYVTLNFGTNDWSIPDPGPFGANMRRAVQEVEQAGRVPVVPLIPWSCSTEHQAATVKFNDAIRQLWGSDPKIVHGPDMWTYFRDHPKQISSDCIHPATPDGWTAYRTVYSQSMVSAVYAARP